MIIALSEVLLVGVGIGVAEKLIFAYVVHELGGSASLCGYGVACMSTTNVCAGAESGLPLTPPRAGHLKCYVCMSNYQMYTRWR